MVLSLRPHGQSRVNPIALALLRSGLQGGPVQTNMQGLGRLAQALSGAFIQAQSDSRDREREQGDARDLSKALQTFSQGVRPFTDPDTGVVQERTGQAAGSAGALTAGLQSVDNPRIMSALAPSLVELASQPPAEQFQTVDVNGTPVQRSTVTGKEIASPRSPTKTEPRTTLGKARADFKDGSITAEDLESIVLNETQTGLEEDEKTRFANADKLRDEFVAQSKDFQQSRDAFARVLASAEEPSAAGDLALIFNYMKVLDPGSVVRESEFENAAATGSFGARIQAAVQRVATGERLADEVRQDFVSRAQRLMNSQLEIHGKRVGQYTQLAQRFDIDPNDIVLDLTAGFSVEQPTSASGAPVAETPAEPQASTSRDLAPMEEHRAADLPVGTVVQTSDGTMEVVVDNAGKKLFRKRAE